MQLDFAAIHGNGAAKARLAGAIKSGKFPHAVMIIGDKGCGKRTLALEIAMALNCEGAGAVPCHRCNSCRRIAENNFPDVKILSRASDKATVGVEEIRLFKADAYLSAIEAKYKVYIFEDSESMTPQAQNALLITLEEPPPRVISILLTADAEKMLTTIKSRAQSIYMERFPEDELERYLLSVSEQARELAGTNPERFSGVVMSASGVIGRALELLSDTHAADDEEERHTVVGIIETLGVGTRHAELYEKITELPRGRAELKQVFESVMMAIRDLAAIKHAGDAPLIYFASREEAQRLAMRLSTKRLLAVYDIIKDAYEDTDMNANVTAMLTALVAKIKNLA